MKANQQEGSFQASVSLIYHVYEQSLWCLLQFGFTIKFW